MHEVKFDSSLAEVSPVLPLQALPALQDPSPTELVAEEKIRATFLWSERANIILKDSHVIPEQLLYALHEPQPTLLAMKEGSSLPHELTPLHLVPAVPFV
jgi:hypothetical protein